MDAPLYPPATRYEAPQRLPRVLNTTESSIADLKADPAAWAIVTTAIPGVERRLGNPFLQQHLGNFSLRSLVPFGAIPGAPLDGIDQQLKALGAAK